MDNIVYNGIDSRSIGLRINRITPFAAPTRRITQYVVPGRNGLVTIDEGTFENVTLEYGIAKYGSRSGDMAAANAIKAWLCQDGQYHRLEDSRWPDHYMMAAATAPEITQIGSARRSVEAVIRFDCLPERWLKSGEMPVILDMAGAGTPSVTVLNPTGYTAHPLIDIPETEQTISIRVRQSSWYGYAEYVIAAHEGTVQIDSFTGNAIYLDGQLGGASANAVVNTYLSGPDDFELRAGESTITATITQPEAIDIKLFTRWWEV